MSHNEQEQTPLLTLHDPSTTDPSTSAQPEALATVLETLTTKPEQSAFKYLRAPSSTQQRIVPHLSDQFFQPSVADIRAQQFSLTSRVDEAHKAQFKTPAMREAEGRQRRARWPTTTIRVKFADMTMLERTFPSTDTIKSVYAFVRGLLHEDTKSVKFVLYQTPPKREFKVSDPKVRNLALSDLELAPSSVLLIKFDDDKLNHQGVPAPLDESVLAVIEDFPTPPDFGTDSDDAKDGSQDSTLKNILSLGSKKDGDGERKLPKWLKLGSK